MIRTALLLMLVAVAGFCPSISISQLQQISITETAPPKKWIQKGLASWYGEDFNGKEMANGEIFNQFAMTCAHRFLPLGQFIWVSVGKRKIKVQVTDRGPFSGKRILDLSYGAAKRLGIINRGLCKVTITLCNES